MSAAAATGMSAAAATGMGAPTTPAATAMATAAVPAASRCNSYALAQAGLGFFIEDVEGGQADVGDFLLAEKNSPCVVLRHYICWCGGRSTARHG